MINAIWMCTLVLVTYSQGPGITTERVRKNVKFWTEEEKSDYVEGLYLLKAEPSPFHEGYSYYDSLVLMHQEAVQFEQEELEDGVNVAHGTPTFPVFFRKLMSLLENKMNALMGRTDMTIPIWDYTDEESTDALLADDFMGRGDPDECYKVTTGKFREEDGWSVDVKSYNEDAFCPDDYLVRATADTSASSLTLRLPNGTDIRSLLNSSGYDCKPFNSGSSWKYSFRNRLEGFDAEDSSRLAYHNAAQTNMGGIFNCGDEYRQGTLSTLDISANDPVFWSLHAFSDFLWATWQRIWVHMGEYEPDIHDANGWHNIDDELYPFINYKDSPDVMWRGITPRDLLFIENLEYMYNFTESTVYLVKLDW